MTTIFIADLHLSEDNPQLTELFHNFIHRIDNYASSLYILGDLFDYWLGDDDDTLFNSMIIQLLKKLSNKGTKVYLMRGNRDFLINQKFARASNCTLLPDEIVIEIATHKILLMHGDTLCSTDTKYLKFRYITHLWYTQQLFLALPITLRRRIAQFVRKKSARHTKHADKSIIDVTDESVRQVLQKNKVYHLIHGHTHQAAVHNFVLNGQIASRTVLSSWHEYGSALIYHANGEKENLIIR